MPRLIVEGWILISLHHVNAASDLRSKSQTLKFEK